MSNFLGTRAPHLQLVIDRTHKRRRTPAFVAVLIFLALTAAAGFVLTGCGGAHVVRGLTVIDPSGFMTDDDVNWIVDHVVSIAPADDVDKILPALEATTMRFVPQLNFETSLGIAIGENEPQRDGDEILIAERGCDVDQKPAAGAIAHEIGHAIGHSGHDYAPWFGSHYPEFAVGSIEAVIDEWWCSPDRGQYAQ